LEKPGHPRAPFIVGAIRSGTTLLRLMLDSHPDMAIPPETSFPEPFLEGAGDALTDGPALAAELAEMKKFADFGISPEALVAALPAGSFPVADGLRAFYLTYAARFSKTRWGDKSPGYVASMREVERLFPEASFIHVIRDGRDTLVSQRDAKSGLFRNTERDAAAHARYWQRCILKGRAQSPELARYMEVRYERLVRETEAVLREVCAFLGLAFHPAMLEYHRHADQRLEELGARRRADGSLQTEQERRAIFQLTTRPPDMTRIGRWREQLSEPDMLRFEETAGEVLTQLGYALVAGGREPESLAAARAELLASPDDPERHLALGRAYEKAGRYDRALACYLAASRLGPDTPRYGASYAHLLERLGRYGEAADLHAVRARRQARTSARAWKGEPLEGKRIVLRRRIRDIGGEVRQARFIARLAEEARSCTVMVEPRLVHLFSRSFPRARVMAADAACPEVDFDMGYEDAASLYGRTSEALAGGFVPLVADSVAARAFRGQYRDGMKRLVGVCWTSSNERKELPAPEDWRPLLARNDCVFISLQYGVASEELARLNALAASPIVQDASVDQLSDMDRFAAQIAALDAVVTISGTAAHLAGALGRPTLLLLGPTESLSWPYDADSTPWYPALRILRLKAGQPWSELMAEASRMVGSGLGA
jgi:tetratricopeptide (TPR) repeat protein